MQFENVTCPHCGLLCDDLTVEVSDLSLQLLNSSHSKCVHAFEDASLITNNSITPLITGNSATIDQALEKATEIIRSSSQPLINGLIADVQTCREAIALTEKVGGVIDHTNSTSIRCSAAVMQRLGEVRTTLAEVRNRSDCVVIFGSGILNKFPRFYERILKPNKTLGTENSSTKKIFMLDISSSGTNANNDDENTTRLTFDLPLLESVVYRLQALITKPKHFENDTDASFETLRTLVQTILTSNYTTFVWSLSEFKPDSAEHTLQALTETIKTLMPKIRCVGLPLSGSKGEVTANQVATWQTGVSLPIAFANKTPIHDPVRYDGAKMLQNGEADCLIWIATYNSADVPPETNIPTIVVGHPKMDCSNSAVFFPAGIPGIDHRGLASRTDSVATLPLRSLRNSKLPAAHEVLKKITQAL